MKRSTKLSLILIIFAIATIMGFFTNGKANTNEVIYVYPSGDTMGVVDANNIEDALLAVAAGGTVVLSEGHFYVSRSIRIDGFQGTFKGEGKDDTFIEAVRGPGGQGFELYYNPDYKTVLPTMVFFYQPAGDVKITDLTTQVIEPNLCDPWFVPWWGIKLNALLNFFLISHTNFNTKLTNVRMIGVAADPGDYSFGSRNALYPYVVEFSESDGRTHVIKNCNFEDVLYAVEYGNMLGDSAIKITENTFTNTRSGIFVYTSETPENCMKPIIKHNIFTESFVGMQAWASSNIRIRENEISECFYGIWLGFSNDNRINENEVTKCNFGISLEYGSNDNLIIGNEVEDSGVYDLFWDGSGTGNIWKDNEYETANFDPDGG